MQVFIARAGTTKDNVSGFFKQEGASVPELKGPRSILDTIAFSRTFPSAGCAAVPEGSLAPPIFCMLLASRHTTGPGELGKAGNLQKPLTMELEAMLPGHLLSARTVLFRRGSVIPALRCFSLPMAYEAMTLEL